jgi:hypothetical protein
MVGRCGGRLAGQRLQLPRMAVEVAATKRTSFDVYGLGIDLAGDWPTVIDGIRLDYAWFETTSSSERQGTGGLDGTGRAWPVGRPAPPISLEIARRAPDYEAHGSLTASFVTPRNVVYQANGTTLVDYFGRALLTYDRGARAATIEGEDEHLVREAGYLFLMSRIGEHLDDCGLVRLHSLGLAGAQGGVAVMLPSGGGKSTLGVRALAADDIRILSEDTPLLDRNGVLHPFVLRLGINEIDADKVPAGEIQRVERMEFHPKLVLSVDAFADRVEQQPQPLRHLVIGRRAMGTEARLEELPRRVGTGTLLREAVVGVGVYQGMEFVLQRGMRDVISKGGVFASRARACAAGLRRARVWELTMGRDSDRNWAALEQLLR